MARKGENIYKRKDGRWEGRYIKSRSSTGKANYGYVYAKSYREVKAKLISQSSCTSNSVTVDPEISSDQFEQVAMEWFQAICPKVNKHTNIPILQESRLEYKYWHNFSCSARLKTLISFV